MGITEVRSRWSSPPRDSQRGASAPRQSPMNDSGHLVRSPGKGGGPASVKRDNSETPPVVGENRQVISDRR